MHGSVSGLVLGLDVDVEPKGFLVPRLLLSFAIPEFAMVEVEGLQAEETVVGNTVVEESILCVGHQDVSGKTEIGLFNV